MFLHFKVKKCDWISFKYFADAHDRDGEIEKFGCRVREDWIENLGLDFGFLGVENCEILS